MTRVRVALVMVGLLLVAGCSSGGDEQADAPDCPPVSTTEPAGTTTTIDPRCVEGAEERDDSDEEAEGEREVWKGTMKHTVTVLGAGAGRNPCGDPQEIPGKARFVVEPNGDVTGTYDVEGCNVSQPHAEFTGTANDEGFSFPQLIVQTNGELIPKVNPTRARATLTNLQGSAAGGAQWVTEWDMRCVNC